MDTQTQSDELLNFFKALVDANRLKIVGLLAQRLLRRDDLPMLADEVDRTAYDRKVLTAFVRADGGEGVGEGRWRFGVPGSVAKGQGHGMQQAGHDDDQAEDAEAARRGVFDGPLRPVALGLEAEHPAELAEALATGQAQHPQRGHHGPRARRQDDAIQRDQGVPAGRPRGRSRIFLMRYHRGALVAVLAALLAGATACGSSPAPLTSTSTSSPTSTVANPGVVTIRMAIVGDPGNPSVGVVQTFGGPPGQFVHPPAGTGIYKTCADAPAAPPSCLTVGGVAYRYGIGEFEVTVSQYVTFLNTVDPDGKNSLELYIDHMSPMVWPKYGSVSYSAAAGSGKHYTVAYPEWAEKPFNFADFRRAARFVNALTNGTVLSRKQESSGGFEYETYEVQLSPETWHGMYDMADEAATRTRVTGFVLPSNDEWVKAAYYDPKGGGTDSYWQYPTGPFDPPNPSKLNPTTGDVVNADTQPLSTYNPNDPYSSLDTPGSPPGAAPNWCPSQAGLTCDEVFPPDLPTGLDLPALYMANVSTVGQTGTPSPWGTYDQGGNVVEVLDTLAPQPPGYNFLRNWRYFHGGVANAPAYQLAISAFGYNPGDSLFDRIYPWLGFRVGVIGNLK